MSTKQLLLFVLLSLLSPVTHAREIWTGSETVSWSDPKNWVSIDAATMGTVRAGDCVIMTYTAEASAQIQFAGNDGSWHTFENRAVAQSATAAQARFYLSPQMVSQMTQGLIVSGTKVTLTSIEIEEGDGADYSNAVWIGGTVIQKDWSNWQAIDKSVFASAVQGHYIRFKFKDILAGAQFGLQYNNGTQWLTMPGVSNVAISGIYQQYTISSDMLTALQTYGCIVRGGGYTLTGIDIIDPATLTPLTLSVASDETNSQWVYTTATPTINITVQNEQDEAVTARAALRVYTDAYTYCQTVSSTTTVAANSTATVGLTLADVATGFYRIYATVNDEMARDPFVIAVQPTAITSAPDRPRDYDSYWQSAKAQLDAVPISATLTEITSHSTAARKVYLVEMQSIPDGTSGQPVTIRGYYCEPQDGERHPVIMHYLGYDSGYRPGGEGTTPYCPSGDAKPGYAEFYLSTRGQSINNRPAADRSDGIDRDFTNEYGDWFAFHFGQKDSYYYRGAYMDCVRAIQFMASRETSDMTNLFAEGQSQGGAFTYAAAALSGYPFRAIAPAIPFMGDFPDYFQVGAWPASVANAQRGTMTDAEMYAFLSYFDTKNLATMISCPVVTSIGLQDLVCPPHTNIAPYNNLKTPATDKQIVFNPLLAHQVNGSWSTTVNNFFGNYEVDENGEHVTTLWENAEGVAISWNGGSNASIAASACSRAKAGDYIQVTLTRTGSMQCQLRSGSKFIVNTSNYVTSSGTDIVFRFGLTELGASSVREGGFYVNGTAFNLKKVELISTGSNEDFSDAIWYGVRECSWTQIAPQTDLYPSAATGWTLRIHHPTLGSTPKIALYTKDGTGKATAITGHGYSAVSGAYTDYTVDTGILTAMQTEGNFAIYGNELTITKIELFNPVKTIDVETVLYEGTTPLTNWTKNYEQPTSIINSLQAGDVLKVTINGNANNSNNCQLRLYLGNDYVGDAAISSKGFPYDYEVTLTDEQVTAIQDAKKLYLNGCDIIVSKWTLTQKKTISRERGNASTTIWTGNEVVSWSEGTGNNSPLIAASAFANAAADMKLRVNFSGMKLGAQGRVIKSDYKTFDGVSIKKLPTECGDYFEYTITSDMLTELQANGMRINGVGYTATSVELIDPAREYVINATYDSDDIIAWEPEQGTPNLTVTLKNNEAQEVTTTVTASLMTDMFADYNRYAVNVTLAAGETRTIDLQFPNLEPGFYRMAAKANNTMLCTYYIGYNPTAIVSPDDSQPDFQAFWDGWKERLAAIPVDATLTLLADKSTGARNVYEVKYQSVPETADGDPVYIYGYYAEPKAAGSYPCIIYFHGTSTTGSLTVPDTNSDTDWCEFRFSARGQTLDREKNGNVKYRTDANDESSADFYAYGLGSNDNHYYRYVYLDTRRAVDFVLTQAKVNPKAIFAAGGSQGGCLTYVCAALSDGHIRGIAPSITGHADFVHTMEIVGWPTNVFNNWINAEVAAGHYADYAAGKAALLAHQSYFDTKNFAKWISCPVITNFSLQDQTDGPHLNISPYNLLVNVPAADKHYSINQFLGHAAKSGWSTEYMAFFEQYIEDVATSYELNVTSAGWATLCLDFESVVPEGVSVKTVSSIANDVLTFSSFQGSATTQTVLPRLTPVVVKAPEGTYTFSAHTTEEPSDTYVSGTNLLKGTLVDVATNSLGGNLFALGNKGGVVGFYPVSAPTFPKNRAYLLVPDVETARMFRFSDDDATAIEAVGSNGLDADGQWYDLQGRPVQNPGKGIYIVNGRKVVIK